MLNFRFPTKIKLSFPIIVFSLGKVISATGQTLFGMKHALAYIVKNNPITLVGLIVIGIAALCSLWVMLVTRVPAISRQLRPKPKIDSVLLNSTAEVASSRPTKMISSIKYFFIFASISSGIFSALGAYLATITLSNYLSMFFAASNHQQQATLWVQLAGSLTAVSTFISYYSFNFYKSRQNLHKLVDKIENKKRINWQDKNIVKTMLVSLASLISTPFLAYFLTKHALLSLPYIHFLLSPATIQLIALYAAIAGIITSFITTVPAAYQYFVKENAEITLYSKKELFLLYGFTCIAGLVDSSANGLSNFISVIEVSHDVFNANMYGKIILFALLCGISSALLTAAFSVRQGFHDYVIELKRKRSGNLGNHSMTASA